MTTIYVKEGFEVLNGDLALFMNYNPQPHNASYMQKKVHDEFKGKLKCYFLLEGGLRTRH